jgi:dipeptidase E
MNLLLLSNSTNPGQPYLNWPLDYIDRFLGSIRNAVFIPYAAVSFSYNDYEAMVNNALDERGIKVKSIHHSDNPAEEIKNAEAILVGGGNTFHLIHMMEELGLKEVIRSKVNEGTHYVGWSAGSNAVCPTIRTTNDMPIIEPKSFEALNLVNFQINPHYTENTISGHGGESRLQRLTEYSAINDIPVVCLPEGCAIRIEDDNTQLLCAEPVKIIYKGGEVKSLQNGMVDL